MHVKLLLSPSPASCTSNRGSDQTTRLTVIRKTTITTPPNVPARDLKTTVKSRMNVNDKKKKKPSRGSPMHVPAIAVDF